MRVRRGILRCAKERVEDDFKWSIHALHGTFTLYLVESCVTLTVKNLVAPLSWLRSLTDS